MMATVELFWIFTTDLPRLLCVSLQYFNDINTLPPSLLFSSGGPDLLEGHGADRHGADGAGGGPAVAVPAEHHHRGLHSLPGHRVLHHLRADLLRRHPRAQVGRWRAPF